MFCTLKAIAGCFHLGGIFLDASLLHSNQEIVSYSTIIQPVIPGGFIPPQSGVSSLPAFETFGRTTIDRRTNNPQGRIALGYEIDFSAKLSSYLDWSYSKPVDGNWPAIKQVAIGVHFKPFAK